MNLDYNQLMCLKISANKLWNTYDIFHIEVYPTSKIIDLHIDKYRIGFLSQGIFNIREIGIGNNSHLFSMKSEGFSLLNEWASFTSDFCFLRYTEQKARRRLDKFFKMKAFL